MLQLSRAWQRSLLRLSLLGTLLIPIQYIYFPSITHIPPSPPSAMAPPPSPSDVARTLLASKGLELQSLQVLQSLWAGYGQICRITATPKPPPSSGSTSRTNSTSASNISPPHDPQSFILKLIAPPSTTTTTSSEGHIRKILSYQVEQYFYTTLAPKLPPSIPTAQVLASMNEAHADGTITIATILSDLKQNYPVAGEKREVLTPVQVHAALDWLADFHGFWWSRVGDMDYRTLVRPPLEEVHRDDDDAPRKTVWLNGGYTYLATRLSEYTTLTHNHSSEWRRPLTQATREQVSVSELIASILVPTEKGSGSVSAEYMTLLHGDVKSENLFTSADGKTVVFYDFQYTGLGLGVC
ncbi:hypothetical protein P280DRAFT_473790, partial [Massarina eburnea CBS 473.64]